MKEKPFRSLSSDEFQLEIKDNDHDYTIDIVEIIRTLFRGIALDYVVELPISMKERLVMLFFLKEGSLHNDASLTELTNRLDISRGAVVNALKALEERGFIRRTGNRKGKSTDITPIFKRILQFKRAYTLSEEKLIALLDVMQYLNDRQLQDNMKPFNEFLALLFNTKGKEQRGKLKDDRWARDVVLKDFLRLCLLKGLKATNLTATLIREYAQIALSSIENRESLIMVIFSLPGKEATWETGLEAYREQSRRSYLPEIKESVLDLIRHLGEIHRNPEKLEDRLMAEKDWFFDELHTVFGFDYQHQSRYEKIGYVAEKMRGIENDLETISKRFFRDLTVVMKNERADLTYYILTDDGQEVPLTPTILKQQIQEWGLTGSTSTLTGGIPVVTSGFLHNLFVKGVANSIEGVLYEGIGGEIGELYYKNETGNMERLTETMAMELVDRYGLDFFKRAFFWDKSGYVSIERELLKNIKS